MAAEAAHAAPTLVVGAGYTGARVAAALRARGATVTTCSRSPTAAGYVAPAGRAESSVSSPGAAFDTTPARPGSSAVSLPTHLRLDLDRDDNAPLEIAPGYRVLYLVPPTGDPDAPAEPRLTRFLSLLAEPPARFVLASTSGVYGDCGGELVDETRPSAPQTERARRRVLAETTLERWLSDRPAASAVLRIAGIYGPGRLPLERLRRREPVVAAAEAGPGNRIHVDDLVDVCLAALEESAPGGIYNVSDGNWASATEFYRLTAELAGLPPPREVSREEAKRRFSSKRLSFLRESRRLDTTRLRRELGVTPRYTELAEGIRASLEGAPGPRPG